MLNIGFQTYGEYASKNSSAKALQFFTSRATFWFSYKTLVAFKYLGEEIVVHENIWGATTGKHLNWIDGGNKIDRVDNETFKMLLNSAEFAA